MSDTPLKRTAGRRARPLRFLLPLCLLCWLLTRSEAAQAQVVAEGSNQDLFAVRGAVIQPGGTEDDPEYLAQYGYTPKQIRHMYQSRSVLALCRIAKGYARKGEFDKAEALLLSTHETEKGWSSGGFETWMGLGDLYLTRGDANKAAEMYRNALYRRDGSINGSYLDLVKGVIVFHKAGCYDEALNIYRKALKNYPTAEPEKQIDETNASTDVLPFVAHVLLALHGGSDIYSCDTADVVAAGRTAVKMHPNDPLGHFALGIALEKLAREEQFQSKDAIKAAESTKEAQAEFEKAYTSGSPKMKTRVDKALGRWMPTATK